MESKKDLFSFVSNKQSVRFGCSRATNLRLPLGASVGFRKGLLPGFSIDHDLSDE